MPDRAAAARSTVVEARAAQGHQADARLAQALQDGCTQVVVDERTDRAGAVGERCGQDRQARLEEHQLVPVLAVGGLQRVDVVGLGVEDRDTHDRTLSLRAFARSSPSAAALPTRTDGG
jgi:hypothetical protein